MLTGIYTMNILFVTMFCMYCLSIKVVTAGLMDIYQRILGLKFTKIEAGEVFLHDLIAENSQLSNVKMWHEDVEQWRVDDATTGNTIGYFYLDLYPR